MSTKAERAARRRKVAKRIRLGESYSEISEALDVSKGTIHNDVKRLKEQWREEAQKSIGEHLSRRLAELRAIKREAYEAWLDSREGVAREKVKTKGEGREVTTVDEDGELDTEAAVTEVEEITREVTRETGGNPRHLRVMLRAEERIAEILGVAEHSPSEEGSRIDALVNTIQETAKQADMSQFEDEEIR
jgi:transposase